MRRALLTVTISLLSVGCATVPQASLEDRTLSYACNDTVVVGTVTNGAFVPVKAEDDILGHGWVSATLHVRKVVRGERLLAVQPVRYFAHTYMRQDQPFMLVLKHTDAGYEIKTGQLMRLRPLLASHCE
jgi:hypothetical protein